MSWYYDEDNPRSGSERAYVFQSSHQQRNRISTSISAAAPPAYSPLRLGSHLDSRKRSKSANTASIADRLLGTTAHDSERHAAAIALSASQERKSHKRRMAEAAYAVEDKRLRTDPSLANAMTTSTFLPRKRTTNTSTVPQGTQLNPVEIDSSPEQDRTINLPGREAYLARKSRSGSPYRASMSNGSHTSRLERSVAKPKYYAVPGGHNPGVYNTWEEVEEQIRGFSGAKHKRFASEPEAYAYLEEHVDIVQMALRRRNARSTGPYSTVPDAASSPYTHHESRSHRASSPSYNLSAGVYDSYDLTQFKYPSHHAALDGESAQRSTDVVVPEPEPVLSSEQQHVVDLILQGHNVFYTGSAGCGKSTILKAFVKQLQLQGKRVKIVAPTNLAALNVNGQTTWNFAGWTPDSMKKSLDKLKKASHGKEVNERFEATDVLVLDEISMVENLMFERLNCIMKESRGPKFGGGPFGGVQLVVTGDFCQLAPVKPFQYCIGCGWELIPDDKKRPKEYRCENRGCREDKFLAIDKWAFRSHAWQECNFKEVNLTEIHRQHDKKFISILQRIRTEGDILPNHRNILLNHTSETENAIKLFSLRADVDRVNNENINRIPTAACRYRCVDHFDWKEHHRSDQSLEKNKREASDGTGTLQALKDHRYEITVQLKEGQRVVLQANLEPLRGLVNGTQGSIIGFEPFDPKKLPRKLNGRADEVAPTGVKELKGERGRYQEEQIKVFAGLNGKQPWPIVQFDNGEKRTIYADCTVNELGNEEPYSLLSRAQIPLMAGYAITVHKSQGMTLDRVIVDLKLAFEPSQIYVALSRARSLQGLKVVGLPMRDLGGANAQVKEFMKNISKKPEEREHSSFER